MTTEDSNNMLMDLMSWHGADQNAFDIEKEDTVQSPFCAGWMARHHRDKNEPTYISSLSVGTILRLAKASYERLVKIRGAGSVSLNLERQAPHIGVGIVWCWTNLPTQKLIYIIEYCSIELRAETGEPALCIHSTAREEVIPTLVDNYIREYAIWCMKGGQFDSMDAHHALTGD